MKTLLSFAVLALGLTLSACAHGPEAIPTTTAFRQPCGTSEVCQVFARSATAQTERDTPGLTLLVPSEAHFQAALQSAGLDAADLIGTPRGDAFVRAHTLKAVMVPVTPGTSQTLDGTHVQVTALQDGAALSRYRYAVNGLEARGSVYGASAGAGPYTLRGDVATLGGVLWQP